jgi:hypothetical protein
MAERSGEKSALRSVGLAMFAGLIAASLVQGLRAYYYFRYVSGYLGRFSRAIISVRLRGLRWPALTRCSGDGEKRTLSGRREEAVVEQARRSDIVRKWAVGIFCVGYSALLLYEDFIYFLLNFTSYL